MKLRAARPEDASALGAILSAFGEQTDWMPRLHTRADDVGFCNVMIGKGWVNVAALDQTVLGFIARNETEVNALYVDRAFQGQGVGAALIQDAQASQDYLSLWTFQDNLQARRFYAGHGFVEGARTDGQQTDERLPDVQLTWQKR